MLEVKGAYGCSIMRRLNRFVVEVISPTGRSEAHLNNTGRLSEYMVEGRGAYCISRSGGRTQHRLFAVDDMGSAALIDTGLQMSAFEAALSAGMLPWAYGCSMVRRSPKLGASTLDYLMSCGDRQIYVEVKSAAMRGGRRSCPSPEPDLAMYPDCPTERGRRHIAELTRHVSSGGRGLMLFIAALPGVAAFAPNEEGDPEVPTLLAAAASAGVELRAISMHYWDGAIVLDDPDLPVIVPDRDGDTHYKAPGASRRVERLRDT